jgi:hypothetical protein
MNRFAKSLRVSLLGLAACHVACTAGRSPATDPTVVPVYILRDEPQWEVRSKKLACSEVGAYLRDLFKNGQKYLVEIKFRGPPKYHSAAALVESLQRESGQKMGYVNVGPDPDSEE